MKSREEKTDDAREKRVRAQGSKFMGKVRQWNPNHKWSIDIFHCYKKEGIDEGIEASTIMFLDE